MTSTGEADPNSGAAAGSAPVARERDPGRAAAFTDAVVAVAMTALVLPLLDMDVSGDSTFRSLWGEYGGQFLSMLLSFVIIAIYWMVHHKVWFSVRTVTSGFLWLNIAWLLGIVLIPFGTVLLYEIDGFPTVGFQIYTALVFYTSLTLGLIVYLITNRRSINVGGVVPQPLWYSLRFSIWWAVVFSACLMDAEGLGQYLLNASALPMIALGMWRPRSLRELSAIPEGS
jgi:uncharacterized membrane protein